MLITSRTAYLQAFSWARMSEIATVLKEGLIEDGEDEAYRYMADVIELSDTEVEYFGLDMEQYRDTTGEDADTLRLRRQPRELTEVVVAACPVPASGFLVQAAHNSILGHALPSQDKNLQYNLRDGGLVSQVAEIWAFYGVTSL